VVKYIEKPKFPNHFQTFVFLKVDKNPDWKFYIILLYNKYMNRYGLVRKYGKSPYRTVVIHGGPGAPGYMAPVGRKLGRNFGVIEPLQSQDSLDGQIKELRKQLKDHANLPVTLIGSSWGAVLSLFLTSKYAEMAGKLILIGSAVFDSESSSSIESIRISRLSEEDSLRHEMIMKRLETVSEKEKDKLMNEWGKLLFKTDVYDPVTDDLEILEVQHNVFNKVWGDFVVLRDNPGFLHNLFSKIDLPVTVIHGEYDPHPISGIRPFLEGCLQDVKFRILPKCGHYPWIERQASEKFFDILIKEIDIF
jgi:pimeloyl-ACP methyl ester carboxylesterase